MPEISSIRQAVFVHLLHGMDIQKYRLRYIKGMEPDASPYGFHLAEQMGFDVGYSADKTGRIYNAVRTRLDKLLGFDVLHALSNLKEINKADIVWTMTEGEAFAIALLMSLKFARRKPIIANAVWVFNKWDSFPHLKRKFFNFLSKRLSVLTVHSHKCIPIATKAFPLLPVTFQPFGINTSMFCIQQPNNRERGERIEVLSLGNDETRDWSTLLQALGNDDRFNVRIICWRLTDQQLLPYKNVEAIRHPTMVRFLEEYNRTDVVVISMVKNVFSGITVALEAVALGKPVIASRTGGVSSYFEENEIIYCEPEDPKALRETVANTSLEELTACAKRAQMRFIRDDYSTKALIRSYADLTLNLLQ